MNNLLSSSLYDNTTFYKSFVKDLKDTQRSVLIESPFITTKRMSNLLPIFRTLRQQGVRMVVNTRNPEEHGADYQQQALLEMQELDITVLYTVKHHRKLAIIDGEILWEGSLNILSQNDSCEIMRRTESEALSRQMAGFVEADKWL
jgi:phosphatidylserine/phosphatidylglycerophosphate/cardiolipin synthase-like enzyme